MKRMCTNNENHKTFSVICHVTEEWKVDENGNFLDLIEGCIDVIHGPGEADWHCAECGAEVKIVD